MPRTDSFPFFRGILQGFPLEKGVLQKYEQYCKNLKNATKFYDYFYIITYYLKKLNHGLDKLKNHIWTDYSKM